MRPQTLIVVVLALAFGGIAAAGVLLFTTRDSSNEGAKATIVVATSNIPRGIAISAGSIVAKEYPKDLIPEGVATKVEDVLGRSAVTPLFKDEPVLEAKLAAKGAGRGLAAILKTGMRAVTIPTPTVASNVAGFLEAGSRVDILWTPPENAQGGDAPLLENVEVLAVDDKTDASLTGKPEAAPIKSVTVQVKPEDAARLAPALTRGTIHLSLRNPADEGRAPVRPVLPGPPPRRTVVAAPVPASLLTIRTLRGTRDGWIRVDVPGGSSAAK